MKSFYEIKKLQAEGQDFGKQAGLRYSMVDRTFVATLHNTDIVKVFPNNDVILATCDLDGVFWRTPATSKAMNQVLNGFAKVYFPKGGAGTLFIEEKPNGEHFKEGVTFNAETGEIYISGDETAFKAWKAGQK